MSYRALSCLLLVVSSLLSTAGHAATPSRTVIFIQGVTTNGQDMFLRGGFDFTWSNANRQTSCSTTVGGAHNEGCSVPITHLNTLHAYTNPWRNGDFFLDWGRLTTAMDGRESTQTQLSSNGLAAFGTPAVWTTNDATNANKVDTNGSGYTTLNTFGPHYWMLDVNIDCDKTINGWFEFKSYITNLAPTGWEGNVAQTQFGGFTPPPYTSGNHFARCGMLNVFQRNVANPVTITTLPNTNSTPTACFTASPSNPKPGDLVTLDATCSTNATEFRWDINNDATIDAAYEKDWNTGKTFAYAFAAAGSYPVKLEVRNSQATKASVVNTVTVTPQASAVRTVIFIQKQTITGQSLAIRGGHDLNLVATGKYPTAYETISAYNNLILNPVEKQADIRFDWDTDSLLNWTTSIWPPEWGAKQTYALNGSGEDPENTWGQHYWKFDANLPGNAGDWFEFKSVLKQAGVADQWEGTIAQAGTPFPTGNHWARKGYITVVAFDQSAVQFIALSSNVINPTANCTVSPTTGTENATMFAFDCSGSTSNDNSANSTLQYNFDFEGNGVFEGYLQSPTRNKVYGTAGQRTVKINVKNSSGGIGSTTVNLTVNAANTAPTACLIVTPSSGLTSTPFVANASCSTNATQYRFKFDAGAYSAWGPASSTQTQFGTIGNHTITVDVQNAAGVIASTSQGVTVTASGPTAACSVSPTSGTTADTYVFSAVGSQNATKYSWDWGIDGTYDTGDEAELAASKVYTSAGTKTARLKASNGEGQSSTCDVSVTVTNANPPTNSKPKAAGALGATLGVGSIDGNFSVTPSGAATYSIPIAVPPGRNNMQPALSLTYSSQGGDSGFIGVGWNLSGLSSITRCTIPRDQGGTTSLIRYTNDDAFCLDGQRLIPITGANGANGTEYRTEQDSFSKIVSYGVTGSGPTSFKVWTKDGKRMEYGAGSATLPISDANSTRRIWSVNSIADSTTDGNAITISYWEPNDTTGGITQRTFDLLPNKIEYVGGTRVIEFVYTTDDSGTPDKRKLWSNGAYRLPNRRLESIQVKLNTVVVREYKLDYSNTRDSTTTVIRRSRLISVEQCVLENALSVCLPKTTFDWSLSNTGLVDESEASITQSNNEAQRTYVIDMNGDGFQDFVYYSKVSSGQFCQPGSTSCTPIILPQWQVAFGTATGFKATINTTTSVTLNVTEKEALYALPMDYDSDGRQDLLMPANGKWGVLRYIGVDGCTERCFEFKSDIGFTGAPGYKNEPRVLDINGDGRQDLLWFNNPTNTWIVTPTFRLNSANGFTSPDVVLPDLEVKNVYAFSVPIPTTVIAGANVDTSHKRLFKDLQVADVNGDGNPDLLYPNLEMGAIVADIQSLPAINCPNWRVRWGTGATFSASQTLPGSWNGCAKKILMGDVNGDGLSDAITGTWNKPNWHIYINKGGSFDSPVDTGIGVQNEEINSFGNYAFKYATVTDMNSDGRADIVVPNAGKFSVMRANIGRDANGIALPGFTYYGLGADFHGETNLPVAKVADFDGDGFTDIVTGFKQGYKIRYSKNETPDQLLTGVTNGMGVKTGVEYGSLADAAIYKPRPSYSALNVRDGNCAYPRLCAVVPMSVVKAHTATNGIGGTSRYSYRYEDLRANLKGHGLLGFAAFEVIDANPEPKTGAARKLVTRSQFSQEYSDVVKGYPYRGRATQIEVRLNDKLLSRTVNTPKLFTTTVKTTPGAAPYFTYFNVSDAKEYEYNDSQNTAGIGSTGDVPATLLPSKQTITTSSYNTLGNATSISVDAGDGHTSTTTNTYFPSTDFTGAWLIDRLKDSTVSITRPANPVVTGDLAKTKTRKSSFVYYLDTGLLKDEIIEPDKAAYKVTTRNEYDDYGHVTKKTVSGADVVSRSVSTTYDAAFENAVFPKSSTNALGHTVTFNSYNATLGVVTKQTDPNGLVTEWSYDGLGRKVRELRADGTYTDTAYAWRDALNTTIGIRITASDVNGDTSIVYYDQLSRDVETRSKAFGENNSIRWSVVQKQYDALGRNYKTSQPTFDNTVASLFTEAEYDAVGRVISVKTPHLGTTTALTKTAYSVENITWGASTRRVVSTTVTDPNGKETKQRRSRQGELIEVKDANDKFTQYDYHPNGNLSWTKAPNTAITKITYDDTNGVKTAIDDPSMGKWTYTYDALGQLLTQTDAKGQFTKMGYDVAGRNVTRQVFAKASDTTPKISTTWTYDQGNMALGQLSSIDHTDNGNSYTQQQRYDALGRPWQTIRTIDGESYVTTTEYDDQGRPLVQRYPASAMGSVDLQSYYDNNGFLESVGIVGESQRVWRLKQTDAFGNISKEMLGNANVTRIYDTGSGYLTSQFAGLDTGKEIQDYSFGYDLAGNLSGRTNLNATYSAGETYSYDNLNRLNGSTRSGGTQQVYKYDTAGNITDKPDVSGTYTYDSTSKDRLKNIGSRYFKYDLNGNMTCDKAASATATCDGVAIDYSAFNKPLSMSKGNVSATFSYDADFNRITKTVAGSKTVYVAGLYEKTVTGNTVTHKFFINAGGKTIAIKTREDNNGIATIDKLNYRFTDLMGSTDVLTDANGISQERLAFDAFGRRRSADWQSVNDPLGLKSAVTDRGYTGHQTDDEFGLINMGGRIYHPELGRFTSPDPNIQEPGNPQNLNRYSYVLNNPFKYTDPTGYFFEPKDRSRMATIVSITIAVVMTACGQPGAGYVVVTGMTAGAAGAFVASNGDLGATLQGAVTGGISAGAFYGVGQLPGADSARLFGSSWNQALKFMALHGLVGGMSSVASGGEFRHGFYAAAFTKGFSLSGFAPDVPVGKMGAGEIAKNAVLAAMVGGTASAISGGSFGSGAVTGAFSRLFNDVMSSEKSSPKAAGKAPDHLIFDGEKLVWRDGNGNVVKSWPANSGIPGVFEPIPAGSYRTVYADDYTPHPGKETAWGPFSFRLHESAATGVFNRLEGRDGGFHIHGGFNPGTAGCIEFTDYAPSQSMLHEFSSMLQSYGGQIELRVNYAK